MSVSAKTVMCGAAVVAISGVAVSASSFKGTATATTTPWWKIPTKECEDPDWEKKCVNGEADESTAPPSGCTPCNFVPSRTVGPDESKKIALGLHLPRQIIIQDHTYAFIKSQDDPSTGTCHVGLTGLQNSAVQARDSSCKWKDNTAWQQLVAKFCTPKTTQDTCKEQTMCKWNTGDETCTGKDKTTGDSLGQVTTCLNFACEDGSTSNGKEECIAGKDVDNGNGFASGALYKGDNSPQVISGKDTESDCKDYATENAANGGQVFYQWQLLNIAGQTTPYAKNAADGIAACSVYGYNYCKEWIKDAQGLPVCTKYTDNFDQEDSYGGVQVSTASDPVTAEVTGLNVVISGGGKFGKELQSNTYLCPNPDDINKSIDQKTGRNVCYNDDATLNQDAVNAGKCLCKLMTTFGTFPDLDFATLELKPEQFPDDKEMRVVTVHLVNGPGVWSQATTTSTTPAPQ